MALDARSSAKRIDHKRAQRQPHTTRPCKKASQWCRRAKDKSPQITAKNAKYQRKIRTETHTHLKNQKK